jgi:nonsense-mediated mRNA decay protein 3
VIHAIDPFTLNRTDIPNQLYWKNEFRSILTSKQLIPYIVLDVTLTGATFGKFALAEAQVARESDFGSNDTIFWTKTHLGRVIKTGDTALGYDVGNANFNEDDLKSMRSTRRDLPDVVSGNSLFISNHHKSYSHLELNTFSLFDFLTR